MRLYLKTKDFSISKEEFELLLDEEKEMLITSPKPTSIESYYNSKDYISHTDSKNTFFEKVYQMVKKYNLTRKLSFINSLNENQKTILDIGSGTGDFLVNAKSKGWSVCGVEPNKDARKKSVEKKIDVLSNLNELTAMKFQVITLWHVLEHFTNFKEAIMKISALLEEDGIVIVAVPNFKSYDARYYKTHWAGYDVPRHLWHFSKKSIEGIFSEFGFNLVRTKPMWFDSFYVSILSERYKGNNFSFIKGVFIGMLSNVKAFFSKEYSSQIYVLKKAENLI